MLPDNKKHRAETNIYHLERIALVRPPRAGKRWKGVRHYKMVMALLDYLSEQEIEWRNPRYHLTNEDMDMVFSVNVVLPEAGLIEVQDADDGEGDAMYPSFGFIASNSRRHQLTFYAGASTIEGTDRFCTERWLGGKYTTMFNPVEQMHNAADEFIRRYDRAEQQMRKMKHMILTEGKLTKIMKEAAFRGYMPWTRTGKIIKAMQQMRTTVWRTGLEFARVAESNPPIKQMDQLYGFTTICREFYPEKLGSQEEIEKVLIDD